MCGRFVITSAPEAIRRLLRYEEQPNFPPRYNIAPTQPVPTVHAKHGLRHFLLARWGLIPSWVKNSKDFRLLFNARLEGVVDKTSFRAAMRHRRCLIPADGYYEWQRDGKAKRPFVIRPRKAGPIAFAGLWETWTDPDGGEIDSATIITCDANRTLAPIHPRMPVIVPPERFDAWLDCDRINATAAAALVGSAPDELLEAWEVSPRVNRYANDSAENLEPVGGIKEPSRGS